MDNAVVAVGAVVLFLAGILFASRGRIAVEDAPIPWAELRAWRAAADARLAAVEEQTRVLQIMVGKLEEVGRGLISLSARVDNMSGVVSTIAQERIAERAARESRWDDRARDPGVTVNTAAPGMHFSGDATIHGPAIGGNVGTMGPPKPTPTERPHTV